MSRARGKSMGRRNTFLIALLSVALIAALLPNASFSGQGDGAAPEPITLPGPLQLPVGLDDQNRQLTVMLELANPTLSKDVTPDQQIAQAQQTLLADLVALKTPVLFQTSMAYNGVAVLTTADQIEQLRALPGVADVHVIAPKSRSDDADVLMAGAPV